MNEVQTDSLHMPSMQAGFCQAKEKVLSWLRHAPSHHVRCAHRHGAHGLKSFWMWNPDKERWDYVRDWEEHKREAMQKFEEYAKAKGRTDNVPHPNAPWIQ